jgi:hypothetical protein
MDNDDACPSPERTCEVRPEPGVPCRNAAVFTVSVQAPHGGRQMNIDACSECVDWVAEGASDVSPCVVRHPHQPLNRERPR